MERLQIKGVLAVDSKTKSSLDEQKEFKCYSDSNLGEIQVLNSHLNEADCLRVFEIIQEKEHEYPAEDY